MRENSVRENQQTNTIDVQNCVGKVHISDMFSKEDNDTQHFQKLRNHTVQEPHYI